MSQTRRRQPSDTFPPTQTQEQVHNTMRTLAPSIKNADEAKTHLVTKGWILPGEEISLELIARTLFAAVADNPKIPTPTTNVMLAAAYIITEKLENGLKLNITNCITKHFLDSIIPITTDIQNRLENHIQAVNDSTKSHSDLAERLQQTQEKLEVTSEKVNKNAKTYSQAAASAATNTTHQQPPSSQVTHSQIQIQNREEIKRRQVLINFNTTPSLALDNLDEVTLSRKALDSINTTWAASPDPKPTLPKLKAATLLRNGGLLIELDTAEGADWLKKDTPRVTFLSNIGSGANIKDRSYQIIAHFVPIQFDPDNTDQLRDYETFNGLEPLSILKAEWIKPIKDRKPSQRVATMRIFHRDAISANKILKEGASVLNKRIDPRKPKKEPIRCLHCQQFGHERRDCKVESPKCGRCAGPHETNSCSTDATSFKCSNCKGHHPSYSRDCPRFWEKCRLIDSRCPENKLAFYPTVDAWTWATIDSTTQQESNNYPPTPPPPRPNFRPGPYQTQLSGTNNTPLGPPRQSQQRPYF